MASREEARRELARRELERRRQSRPVEDAGGENGGVAGALDSFGRGVVNASTLSFGDELGAAARWAGGKVLPWRDEVTWDQALEEVRGGDRAVAEESPVANALGNLTGALGLGAGMVKAGISPTARAIDAGWGLGRVSGASALEGAILGGAQGYGAGEGDDRLANAAYGGTGGGLIGLAVPGAMQVAGSVARRAVSPFLGNPERQAMVNALTREGVETTAGQRTGSAGLRYAESEIGGRTAQDLMERQGEQFTAAALRRAGTTANRATPEVIDDAFTKIGQQFDDLASRNSLTPDRQLATDLGSVWTDYAALVPETARAPVVMDLIQDIGKRLGQGNLDGAAYQAARSRIDRMARSSAKDPQLSEALYGLRTALDDGMERSISTSNPADAGAWREARKQYRNMLVLEKAATGAGENAALGLISPSQLRNATVTKQGRRNYARGSGDFAELSRAGEAIMKAMPNSGTAGRLNAQNLGIGLAGLLGGAAGTATGDPKNAVIGALLGLGAPKGAGMLMMNPTVQRYLANQLAQSAKMTPQIRSVINSLLNVEGSEVAPSAGRALLGR